MAHERFYLHCPVCGKTEYLSKSSSNEMSYSPPETIMAEYEVSEEDRNSWYASHLNELFEWMRHHLKDCHQQAEFESGKVLFEVVPEISALKTEDMQLKRKREIAQTVATGYRAGRESLIPYIQGQLDFWQSEMNAIGATVQEGGEVKEDWHALVSAQLRKAHDALKEDRDTGPTAPDA